MNIIIKDHMHICGVVCMRFTRSSRSSTQ